MRPERMVDLMELASAIPDDARGPFVAGAGAPVAGVLGGAVDFSPQALDNVAGVALVRAAGGVVTDLAGRPWTVYSDSVLAAAPGVHDELLDLTRAVGYGGCS